MFHRALRDQHFRAMSIYLCASCIRDVFPPANNGEIIIIALTGAKVTTASSTQSCLCSSMSLHFRPAVPLGTASTMVRKAPVSRCCRDHGVSRLDGSHARRRQTGIWEAVVALCSRRRGQAGTLCQADVRRCLEGCLALSATGPPRCPNRRLISALFVRAHPRGTENFCARSEGAGLCSRTHFCRLSSVARWRRQKWPRKGPPPSWVSSSAPPPPPREQLSMFLLHTTRRHGGNRLPCAKDDCLRQL